MKKLKLQTLGLSVNDLLTREQMKKVMGGSGTGSGSTGGGCNCPMFWHCLPSSGQCVYGS